jgi:hypothetical protein
MEGNETGPVGAVTRRAQTRRPGRTRRAATGACSGVRAGSRRRRSLTGLAAGVLLGASLRATLALAGLALVPFLAYAVHHSRGPTGVLPPRPAAAGGGLAGLALAGAGPAGSAAPVVAAGATLALGGGLFGALARPPSRKR